MQLALTILLNSWGVHPEAVVGHSSGEIAAAHAAGALEIDQCMKIAYQRGIAALTLRRNQPLVNGKMLAVGASPAEIEPIVQKLTQGEAVIACVNSPASITASGDEPAILELERVLEDLGVFNRRLRVDLAYHSHHMQLIAAEYRRSLGDIIPKTGSNITFHSSLTGQKVDHSVLRASYWVDNLTNPVLFSQAIQSMAAPLRGARIPESKELDLLVEIGPHAALEGPVKQILKSDVDSKQKIDYAPSLLRATNAIDAMLRLASTLFIKGVQVDLGAVNFPRPPAKPLTHLHDLPTYPWQHTNKYWNVSRIAENHRHRRFPRNDYVGSLTDECSDLEPIWRNIVCADDLPWLRNHRLNDIIIYPMAGFIVMAMEAARQRAIIRDVKFDVFVLRDVSVTSPLMVSDSNNVETRITLRSHAEGTRSYSDHWDEFRIQSWTNDKGWLEHCRGLISARKEHTDTTVNVASEVPQKSDSNVDSWSDATEEFVDCDRMYKHLEDVGLKYGKTFRGIAACRASSSDAVVEFEIPNTAEEMPKGYETETTIHPAVLDTCIQVVWPILGAGRRGLKQLSLPSFVKEIVVPATQSNNVRDRLCVHGVGPTVKYAQEAVTLSFSATFPDLARQLSDIFDGLLMTPVNDGSA